MSQDSKDPAQANPPERDPEARATDSKEQLETPAATSEAKPDLEPKTSVQDAAAEAPTEADAEDDAVLDATGRERPRFLLSFPQDPDLMRLATAFEAGNYALVRAEAEALAERTESPAVRAAALELRRRIEPDPLAKYLLALTAALLLSLAYFAYHH
jgi:hypothetical protein